MATIGDVAKIIDVIARIINAIETAQKLKQNFLEFKEYLWCISKNLEQLQGQPLSNTVVETLQKLKDILENAYLVIDSSQNHNFVYLMVNGAHIQKRIKKTHNMVVDYMGLIPIMHFGETIRLLSVRTNIISREPHESAPNTTDAASTSGCLMAQGECSSQIVLSNQAESKNDLRIFKFKELRSATNNFRHDHLIGSGGSTTVYKGLVKDNNGSDTIEVAIKRAREHSFKEGEAEVKYLERISHPNVIKVLGYCNKIDTRKWIGFHRKEANIYLSVTEYMANGNLSDHLFSDKQALEHSWAQRIKIANGSARALAYLHECRIIHRDVKSANIVLDSDFNSKLIDFGLTMDFPTYSTDTHGICGTMGYIAPEYLAGGQISEKIDVYGYGATLLEILSGQRISKFRPQEFQSPEDISMFQKFQSLEDSSISMSQEFRPVDLSTNYLQKFIISSTSDLENLNNLMDPRLDGKYPLKAAHLAVQLTLNCVAGDPNKRPSMEEVIKVLEQIQTIKMPSTTLAPDRIISDPCDPLPCDLDFLVSRSMVYESAPFDADAELSFSVPRSMMMSEPAPYDADAELPFSLSKSMVYESSPFDAETELSFPKFKTSHSPIH